MADTTPLAPCPFCGAPAHGYAIEPHSHSPSLMRLIPGLPDHPGSYVIEGQCACGSGLIGEDETEVVARWNRRATQPAHSGEPVALTLANHEAGEIGYCQFTSPVPFETPLYAAPKPVEREPLTAGQIEAEVRKDDEALIRQMLEALSMPCDRWNATQSVIVRNAIDAANAWLEGTP